LPGRSLFGHGREKIRLKVPRAQTALSVLGSNEVFDGEAFELDGYVYGHLTTRLKATGQIVFNGALVGVLAAIVGILRSGEVDTSVRGLAAEVIPESADGREREEVDDEADEAPQEANADRILHSGPLGLHAVEEGLDAHVPVGTFGSFRFVAAV
jgi:hypothetical protein